MPRRPPTECHLAKALGGDQSVVNAGRVLRLGGSIAWSTKEDALLSVRSSLISRTAPQHVLCGANSRAFCRLVNPNGRCPGNHHGRLPDNETPPTPNIGASGVSVETCIAAIRAGDRGTTTCCVWWDTDLARLVRVEIPTAAEPMTLTVTRSTQPAVRSQMIMGTQRGTSPILMRGSNRPEAISLRPEFLDGLDLGSLPSRRWILGRALLRGHLSLLVAPAGVGKSTHGIARAVAIASGRDLTGEAVHESVRTWIYNAEDDDDELKRRLGAVLQHHAVPFDDIRGRLALNLGADRPLLFARADRKELVIRQPDVDASIAQIREHDIGLFVVDPFIETHEVDEIPTGRSR